MTWESGSSDHQRLRAGYAVLSIGVLILLGAWALAVMRGPQAEGDAAIRRQKLDPPTTNRYLPKISAAMIVYGTVLVVVLFVSVITLLRMSRNYRKMLFRAPPKPTQMSNVWKMHKIPELFDEDPPTDADQHRT